MRAFNFEDFCLNEGAALSANGKLAELSWRDTDDPDEFLKSNYSFDTTNFTTRDLPYNVMYGLSVDPSRIRELNKSPKLKLLLDHLKDSNILGGNRALTEFVKPAVDQLRRSIGKVDYIIPMGSTKGLSEDLANSFASLASGSDTVNLDKYTFDNITSALDWDYIEDYETNKAGRPQKRNPEKLVASILPQLVRLILKNVDIEKSSDGIEGRLRGARDWKELKGILLASQPVNRYFDDTAEIVWKDESSPFIIRSSNLSVMGDRKFLKTKYDTPKAGGIHGDPDFIEAVRQCIFSNKSLLITDDNTRTKEDIKGILQSIDEIAKNLIADSDMDIRQRGYQNVLNYRSRINIYVLIYIPPTIGMASSQEVEDLKQQLNANN